MNPAVWIRIKLRRLLRRHPRVATVLRGSFFFVAAYSAAYGFVTGARSGEYDPQSFAVGASFLFACACVGLAMMSMRARWLKRQMRKIAAHNDTLADRNWELKEAEERARTLFEAQGDVIVVRNTLREITFANDAYCQLAGKPRVELVGTAFELPSLEVGESSTTTDGARSFDQRVAGAMGDRWIAWREQWIRLDANCAAQLQCVGRDVTDRAAIEHALAEARDQSDAANRAKSRFLAVASHEIRTPLNGILGMSSLLLDTPLSAEQTTYARAIKTSGDALMALIDEILDFSKIEAGKIDIESRPFALTELIEELTELLAPRAQLKGLEIAAYVDERLPAQVVGDMARLRQVLLNVAGNAIKFTERGGVALLAEPGLAADDIVFTVRDTGIGIAPEAREKIFREFEQADDRTARNYGGTGLGLSISERLIRRMGGRITLDSTLNVGSTFEVTLRLPAFGSASLAFVPPNLTGIDVLLVTGQAIEASLIARRLQRWGAQTAVVTNADVAGALLPERSWHTIIIDTALGEPTVKPLLQQAGRDAKHCVVMLTPSERRSLDQLKADGCDGYLVKPVRAASLAARFAAEGSLSIVPDEQAFAPLAVPRPAARGLSVLVAEDNEINALLTRSLLSRLGHRPVVATSGHGALESWIAAQSGGAPYDVVLMDLQMPELDGIETTKRIREREAQSGARHTPIYALTANAVVEDRYACFEAGMDGFLVKPLDRDRLAELLQRLSGVPHIAA